MRRIATVVLAGATLGMTAPAQGAVVEQDYDSFTVTAGAKGWGRNDARLSSAYRYHMIVTGSSTVSGSDGSGSQFDAQYCFASSSPQCTTPFPEDAAIGFGIGKEGGGQSEVDAIYGSGNFEGISEFGEGTGARETYNGGHTYQQYFTVGSSGYYNLYAMAWRKYSPDDGVSRTGSFTIQIKRTSLSDDSGGSGGSEPSPSGGDDIPDTVGGVECTGTSGYRLAWAAARADPTTPFCLPEDFVVSGFGLIPERFTLKSGKTRAVSSPKLGSATKATVEVKGKDAVVSVTDPGFRRFARMQCVTAVVNPDSEYEDLGTDPADRKLLTQVPFLAVSLARQRLIACLGIVNRLLEAEAAREKARGASAGTARAGCGLRSIPAAYGSGTSLDRLRVRLKSTPKPSRTLSITCRRTAGGVALTVATRKPGQPLKSIVGNRLTVGVMRPSTASESAVISASFRR